MICFTAFVNPQSDKLLLGRSPQPTKICFKASASETVHYFSSVQVLPLTDLKQFPPLAKCAFRFPLSPVRFQSLEQRTAKFCKQCSAVALVQFCQAFQIAGQFHAECLAVRLQSGFLAVQLAFYLSYWLVNFCFNCLNR